MKCRLSKIVALYKVDLHVNQLLQLFLGFHTLCDYTDMLAMGKGDHVFNQPLSVFILMNIANKHHINFDIICCDI